MQARFAEHFGLHVKALQQDVRAGLESALNARAKDVSMLSLLLLLLVVVTVVVVVVVVVVVQ